MDTYLIWEFLSREVISCLLEKKDTKKIFDIVEKYFKGTILGEELDLFKAVLSVRGKNKEIISKVLNEVSKYASKIDQKKLLNEKTKLIKEISDSLSSKIFDYKIKDYRLLASIQIFLNSAMNKNIKFNESIKSINNQEDVFQILQENLVQEKDCSKTKYDSFIYLNVIDNITDEIRNLRPSQKKIMLEYLDIISSNKPADKFFESKLAEQKNIFDSFKTSNEDINKKLSFARNKFESLSDKTVCEESKLKMLLEFNELFEEIESDNK
jgi:hypothetical protein